MGDNWARADTGGMQAFGGSRAPSVGVLARADSVAGARGGGGGGGGGGMNRPGTAKLGPQPRRPPSIMPVMRPRTAATGGAAQASGARPLPPAVKISAHAFRVEKKGSYQGELNVPSILFIGKAGDPEDPNPAKQKRALLSKYKLRPGALEELGIEEDEDEDEDLDTRLPRAGGATSPQRKAVTYDMAPYGGKREMDSLRKQIVETETAALESRMQSQTLVSKTQSTVAMVEEKVGHVRESNQQLDSELVEIEKQIEELKRISRSQIDEIKALRDNNKHKESKLHSEQQELQRMEGTIRDAMLIAKESKDQEQGGGVATAHATTAQSKAGAGAGGGSGRAANSAGAAAAGGASVGGAGVLGGGAGGVADVEAGLKGMAGITGEPAYKGDKAEKAPDHPELHALLQLCDNLENNDGRIWAQTPERRQEEQEFLAQYASEDYLEVPAWLAHSKPPPDWSAEKGSHKLHMPPATLQAPVTDMEMEHVYGYGGASSVDAIATTGAGKLLYPAASICIIHDLVHKRQRFFNGHDDAVLCLTLHPEGQLVASGDVGKSCKVLVWDSESPHLPSRASLWGFHKAGIAGLAFSRDGNKLATVGRDVDHCLCVWDWRKEERLVTAKTGINPVLAVRFHPVSSAVITAGVRHLKFWTIVGTRLQVDLADFNKKGSLQTLLSIAFMYIKTKESSAEMGGGGLVDQYPCCALTGTQDGGIYVWNTKGQLISFEKKAHEGPVTVIVAPRQRPEHDAGTWALTGGADGKVRRWDAHQNLGLAPVWTIDLEEKTRALLSPFSSRRSPIRAIGCSNAERIYVGTSMNEIYEFAPEAGVKVPRAPEATMLVMAAHTQGNIYSVDMHPLRQEVVTVAWDATLRIWDTKARECTRALQLLPYEDERKAFTAVQYSPDGEHIAVGCENGEVWILDATAIAAAAKMNWDCEKFLVLDPDDQGFKLPATPNKAVNILRYSPDGSVLIAACLGGNLILFQVQGQFGENSYEKLKTLLAHQCNIRSLDFSEDGKMLQTTGLDNHLRYWQLDGSPASCTSEGQLKVTSISPSASTGDVVWDSWSSALGWPMEGLYDSNCHDSHALTSAFAAPDKRRVLAWRDQDVYLYAMPCRPGAQSRRFKGHASVPADVRFLHKDAGFVSVGSKDMCIIQWKPPDAAALVAKEDDAEVCALIGRCSELVDEGLLVRLTIDDKPEQAFSTSQSNNVWKEVNGVLALLLQVNVERFQLVRLTLPLLTFEIRLLPHALGWNVEPSPATLLKRLQDVYANGLINRKLPKISGDLEVLQGTREAELDEQDDFLGLPPWLGLVCAPPDWTADGGSKELNYAPASRFVEVLCDPGASTKGKAGEAGEAGEDLQGAVETKLVLTPLAPSLVGFDDERSTLLQPNPLEDQQREGHESERSLLTLDYVHGFQGWLGGGNVFYLDGDHLVYSAGRFGIVEHLSSKTQRFMQGHMDQISAMAMAQEDAGNGASSEASSSQARFATAELGARGTVRVWQVSIGSSDAAPLLTGCLQGFHNCSIAAVCFMEDGMLVSVGTDDEHHVAVWDLNMQARLCSARGDVTAILAVDSPGEGEFVTVGVSHIKFWRVLDGEVPLQPRGGIFGNKGHVQTIMCLKTLYHTPDPKESSQLITLTGTEDGSIYLWKDRILCHNLAQAHKGPVFCLCLSECAEQLVVSGAKDGCILISSYHLEHGLKLLFVLDTSTLNMVPKFMTERRSIRAVATSSAGDGWLRLAFGTGANDLVELELDVRNSGKISVLQHSLRPVKHGHALGSLTGLCTHADLPEFATVGQDGVVRLWHSSQHRLTAAVSVAQAATALDYALGLDQHLAVGLAAGGVVVLNAAAVRRGHDYSTSLVLTLSLRKSEISDLKYSPDGHYLAVAYLDNVIDVYMVKNKYNRWGVCRGHRHVVRQMDWACDSVTLRSNDSGQQLLFWNVETMSKGVIAPLEAQAHVLQHQAWATNTAKLTWPTQAACQAYASVEQIAAVDRSRNGALLSVADCFGNLRLFRYPSCELGLNQVYAAHCGPVTNVRFAFDDSSLLTISSADMCLVQWKLTLVSATQDVDTRCASLLTPRCAALTPPSDAALQPHSDMGETAMGAMEGAVEGAMQMQLFKPFHAAVFAPSIWNAAGKQIAWQADSSLYAVPLQELELERLHGCRGHDRHAHVLFNRDLHAVYYSGKIVVVQDREHGLQRFFLGHSEDISSLVDHPHGRLFASAQTGTRALICVWDSQKEHAYTNSGRRQRSLQEAARFECRDAKGICALTFSHSGDALLTVSDNEEHWLTLWDWQRQQVLSVVKGSMNRTLAVAADHFQSASAATQRFLTCGVKHVRFWQVQGGQLVGQTADLSSKGVLSIQLSCCFSKLYGITGNQEGALYIWKEVPPSWRLVTTLKAHNGPVFSLHTAAHESEGVPVFCSGAADGIIRLWSIKSTPIKKHKPDSEQTPSEDAAQHAGMRAGSKQWVADGGKEMHELHCYAAPGIKIQNVIQGLNVPSVGQEVSVVGAFLQFEPSVKTIMSDGVWRILVGTSINEVYQLTLAQLMNAPNHQTTEVHDGQLERETVKVYTSVTYGDEGVGAEKLPAIQLLVQSHAPLPAAPALAGQGPGTKMVLDGAASNLRALAVHPHDEKAYATCAADGVLRIWDGNAGRVSFMYRMEEMVASMCYSPCSDCNGKGCDEGCYHLALGCTGKVLVMDASVPLVFGQDITVLATLDKSAGVGARDTVTCLRYSATCSSNKNCYLAAGLSSGCIVIFKATIDGSPDKYEKYAKFKGHSGAVFHMDFSKQPGGDPENLQSNCSRFELRFWDLRNRKECKSASSLRDSLWESTTCSLSWATLGIKADDYALVPAVDRSLDVQCMVGAIWPDDVPLLAVSGADGQVTLARYPCVERCEVKSCMAHSLPASALRFTYGAQNVVSVGNYDMSVCQWRRQLPVHVDVEAVLDVPRSMKARIADAHAVFMAKDQGRADAATGPELGAQAAFDDAKPFLSTTKLLQGCGFDDFDPDDLLSAGRLHLAKYDMKLEHVHGSRGHCGLNHVCYNQEGDMLLLAASVVIVQAGQDQIHHFQGHDDEVLCIDVSHDGLLAATGQVADKGKGFIWLWFAASAEKVSRIDYPRDGGVYAVSFKPSVKPSLLASIANDEDCTIDVWDVRDLKDIKPLTCIAADRNRVLALKWNPFHQDETYGSLVTCGDKHLNFWTFQQSVQEDIRQEASDVPAAIYMIRHHPIWKDTTKQTALSISFVQQTPADSQDDQCPHGYTLTGMQDGSVFLWRWHEDDSKVFVLKVLPSLHTGPIFSLVQKGDYILSGGNDGFVKMWNLESFGDGAPPYKQIDLARVVSSGTCVSTLVPPSIRCLSARMSGDHDDHGDHDRHSLTVLAATASNEIFELGLTGSHDGECRVVLQAHGGSQLQGLAMHPGHDSFATVGSDAVVRIFDLASRSCIFASLLTDGNGHKVGGQALCFRGKVDRPVGVEQCPVCKYGTVEKEHTFHCDELAVGTANGHVVIFKMGANGQLLECGRTQFHTKAITCLQYSPTGTLLACASEDMLIDILLPDEDHRRMGVCKGHLAPISSIDWTQDAEFMQTSDTSLELMFWSLKTRTEKAIPEFLAYEKPMLLYKRHWASFRSPLAWPWQGIYTPGSEAVGLNGVDRFILDRASKKALGVCADATGLIKLFPYPTPAAGAAMQARNFDVHSASVSSVRFSASGKYVVSTGGRDRCAIQWQVLAPQKDQGLDLDQAVGGTADADDDSDDDDELDQLKAAPKKLSADEQYNKKGRT